MSTFKEIYSRFAASTGPSSRLRFAPTPSGYLHAGNALNFTLNWAAARLGKGKILLRIDDLDADRKRPEYVADIFESLSWLGLDWDETPDPIRIFPEAEPWSQWNRLPLYADLLDRLRKKGVLFACKKSRAELAKFGGSYPAEFRNQGIDLDEPDVAWRIKTPEGFPMPDFVVRRRDGIPAYQPASLADDLHFGVSHIVRGQDLEPSTHAQRFLAECLGEASFNRVQIIHHPLILDENGEKLSKSAGAESLKNRRERGENPGFVFENAAGITGLSAGARSAAALLELLRKSIRSL